MHSYQEIIRMLNHNIDLSTYAPEHLETAEHLIIEKIHTLLSVNNNEDIAVAYCYYIIFCTKIPHIEGIEDIVYNRKLTELYTKAKEYFLKEEQTYQDKLKHHKEQKKVHYAFLSFYKLVQMHFSALEKSLLLAGGDKVLINTITIDRIYFIEKQYFLEGNIKDALSYFHLFFVLSLKRYQFLYSFLGAVGIVLIWQGIWEGVSLLLFTLNAHEHPISYIIITVIGFLLLSGLGIFTKQTVGMNKEEFMERYEVEAVQEIRHLESIIAKRKTK